MSGTNKRDLSTSVSSKNLGNVQAVIRSNTEPKEANGEVKKYVLWAQPYQNGYLLQYYHPISEAWTPLFRPDDSSINEESQQWIFGNLVDNDIPSITGYSSVVEAITKMLDKTNPELTIEEAEALKKALNIEVIEEIVPEEVDKAVNSQAVMNWSIQKINTMAELRKTVGKFEGQVVELIQYYDDVPAPAVKYKWTAKQGVDDGGFCIVITDEGSWVAQFGDTINALNYGVKSGEGYDNSDIFNNIINHLNTVGGTLFIPKGTYYANIIWKTNVNIVGEGVFKTVIKSVAGSNLEVIKTYDFERLANLEYGYRPNADEGIRYSNLSEICIDGNYANNTLGCGIKAYGSAFHWSNVYVQNCREHGIYTSYGRQTIVIQNGRDDMRWNMLESKFENITINGCDGDGWFYAGPHDAIVSNLVVARCKGWGFNQVQDITKNAGLKLHTLNIYLVGNGISLNNVAYISGNSRVDNNKVGIGVRFKSDVNIDNTSRYCVLTDLIVTGFEVGLDIGGGFHMINANINNCITGVLLRGVRQSHITTQVSYCDTSYEIDNNTGSEFGNIINNVSGWTSATQYLKGSFSAQDYVRFIVAGQASQDIIQEPYNTCKIRGYTHIFPMSDGTIVNSNTIATITDRGIVKRSSVVADPSTQALNQLTEIVNIKDVDTLVTWINQTLIPNLNSTTIVSDSTRTTLKNKLKADRDSGQQAIQ